MNAADGSPLEAVLTSFSPTADVLAISSGDGRIKAWDVSSSRVRADLATGTVPTITDGAAGAQGSTSGFHLTALAWGQVAVGKASKKHKPRTASPLLAATSSTGAVLAWDAALGELRWRTDAAHAGAAEALAFGPAGGVLYSGGADGQVCQMEAATGTVLAKDRLERHGIAALAVSPDGGQLLVASSRIRLIDLASKKKLRKLAGHASRVRALAFSPDGAYGLSAAAGDRHVAVWDLVGAGRGGSAQAEAAALLAMEEPAVSISCSRGEQAGGVTIVALAQSGEAYVWQGQGVTGAAAAEPTRIRVGGKGRRPEGAAAVLAALAQEEQPVLLAHGSAASPHFETVSTTGRAGERVWLTPAVQGALLEGTGSAAERAREEPGPAAVVVGPESGAAGAPAALHPPEGRGDKKSRKKRRADQEAGEGAGPMEVEGAAAEAEVTLGERVAALELDAGEAARGGEGAGEGAAAGPTSPAPRAHSLQVLLTQALASNDGQLLEKCLAVGDEKVISNTVRRLRPSEASSFLSTVTAKFQSKPSRGVVLLPWIRALLLQHAGSLMAAPGVQPTLLVLHQLIDARLSVFKPLLALSGRLDLMMAQIFAFPGSRLEEGVANEVDASTAVYEEGHSDDEGVKHAPVEDVQNMETSDSEGGENGEEGEDGDWETDDGSDLDEGDL